MIKMLYVVCCQSPKIIILNTKKDILKMGYIPLVGAHMGSICLHNLGC